MFRFIARVQGLYGRIVNDDDSLAPLAELCRRLLCGIPLAVANWHALSSLVLHECENTLKHGRLFQNWWANDEANSITSNEALLDIPLRSHFVRNHALIHVQIE